MNRQDMEGNGGWRAMARQLSINARLAAMLAQSQRRIMTLEEENSTLRLAILSDHRRAMRPARSFWRLKR